MTVSSDIHRCCARGFCGSHTISQCHSSYFLYPSFPVYWTGCREVLHIVFITLMTVKFVNLYVSFRGVSGLNS
jgi:hypothetical protein